MGVTITQIRYLQSLVQNLVQRAITRVSPALENYFDDGISPGHFPFRSVAAALRLASPSDPREHPPCVRRPGPSGLSEGRDEPERQLDEEQERRIRLQLYVFVVRCIAYPFNAKQPTDMARRQQKLNKQQLQLLKERFQAFLNGETQIVADEAFCNAVRSYYEIAACFMDAGELPPNAPNDSVIDNRVPELMLPISVLYRVTYILDGIFFFVDPG
ncbi:Calcium-dependent secretion activator 2 [Fukomys damarensis]|uniref:Calcium-dependent secretion activator 2 n=1 Tax=Fukomys damarensis TaxID=885580 RepID=A0A091E0N8_FUKDA|nr:Calcium-dependent secretion activator 2 [Fukomys damarensis]